VTLSFLFRPDRLVESLCLRDGKIEALAPVEAEIGGPHWVFRQRYYDFLPDGRIVASNVQGRIRSAVVIADTKIALLDVGQVQECPRRFGEGLAFIATPPTAPPSVCIVPRIGGGAPSVIRSAAPAVVPEETISLGEPIQFATPGGVAHAFWSRPGTAITKGQLANCPRSSSCRMAGRPA